MPYPAQCSERLAAAAELAEFRAMGVRPAPRRQLARIDPPVPSRSVRLSRGRWS